jgi:glutaconate CoA-transferase subunit A
MASFQSLTQAVSEAIGDGDCVAFEGFTHLIPHAAAHETIRQGRRNLTLVRMTPDIIYDQLIGMGCAKKLIFSYAGNPGVGLLRRLRDAVENDWPKPLEIEEHSHAAMANAYEAGAAGLPFAMLRGYVGTGLRAVTPTIREVTCPFTGEVLAAVPALRPDVGVIHAQRANRRGDVLLEGILGVQKETVLSAARSIITVEEIVDDFDDLHPNACVLPHFCVGAIALVPGGAHPSYARGYYERDNASYVAWDEVSADRERFLRFMEDNVLNVGPEVFADRVRVLSHG